MIKVKKREVARWKKDHISVSIFITRMEGKELYFILTKNHTEYYWEVYDYQGSIR